MQPQEIQTILQELYAERRALMATAPRTGTNNKGGRFRKGTPELKRIQELTAEIHRWEGSETL